jgi:hypothetical protein
LLFFIVGALAIRSFLIRRQTVLGDDGEAEDAQGVVRGRDEPFEHSGAYSTWNFIFFRVIRTAWGYYTVAHSVFGGDLEDFSVGAESVRTIGELGELLEDAKLKVIGPDSFGVLWPWQRVVRNVPALRFMRIELGEQPFQVKSDDGEGQLIVRADFDVDVGIPNRQWAKAVTLVDMGTEEDGATITVSHIRSFIEEKLLSILSQLMNKLTITQATEYLDQAVLDKWAQQITKMLTIRYGIAVSTIARKKIVVSEEAQAAQLVIFEEERRLQAARIKQERILIEARAAAEAQALQQARDVQADVEARRERVANLIQLIKQLAAETGLSVREAAQLLLQEYALSDADKAVNPIMIMGSAPSPGAGSAEMIALQEALTRGRRSLEEESDE